MIDGVIQAPTHLSRKFTEDCRHRRVSLHIQILYPDEC